VQPIVNVPQSLCALLCSSLTPFPVLPLLAAPPKPQFPATPPFHALQLLDRTDAFIRKQPKISGNYEQILGRSLEGLVNRAEELKVKWKVGGQEGVECACGWGAGESGALMMAAWGVWWRCQNA
jgi:hypothetical protein